MKNLDAVTANEDVPTKKYVDDAIAGGISSNYVPLTGGGAVGQAMTGDLYITKTEPRVRLSSLGGIYEVADDILLSIDSNGLAILNGARSAWRQFRAGNINSYGTLDNDNPNSGASGASVIRRYTGAGNWAYASVLTLQCTAGSLHAGLAFHHLPRSIAPFIRVWDAERFDFLNTANTAYVPLWASAFTVQSTEKSKIEIHDVTDDILLDQISGMSAHRFLPKVPPQNMRLKEGGDPDNSEDYTIHDHDCAIDPCEGTSVEENPCASMLNYKPRYGLLAENVSQHLPQAAVLNADGSPEGYSVDAAASAAIGGVSALIRKVEALTARVAALEQQIAGG